MGGAVQAVSDIVHEVTSPIVTPVVKTAEAVVKNPLPVLETMALTAAGVPAPIAAAAVTAANGGSVENVARAAISSYAGGEIGGATGTAVAGATENVVLANIAGSAAGSAASTLIKGGNLDNAFANAVLGAAGQGAKEGYEAITTPETPPLGAPEGAVTSPVYSPEVTAQPLAPLEPETLVPPAPQAEVIPDQITQPSAAGTLPEVQVTAQREVPFQFDITTPTTTPTAETPTAPVAAKEEKAKPEAPSEEPKAEYKPDLFIYGGVRPKMAAGGSQVLAQTLGVSPYGTLPTSGLTGYRGAGEIESSETGKQRRDVWNEASLRLKDALGL